MARRHTIGLQLGGHWLFLIWVKIKMQNTTKNQKRLRGTVTTSVFHLYQVVQEYRWRRVLIAGKVDSLPTSSFSIYDLFSFFRTGVQKLQEMSWTTRRDGRGGWSVGEGVAAMGTHGSKLMSPDNSSPVEGSSPVDWGNQDAELERKRSQKKKAEPSTKELQKRWQAAATRLQKEDPDALRSDGYALYLGPAKLPSQAETPRRQPKFCSIISG